MVAPKKEMSSTAKSMLSVRITAPTLGDVLSFCPSEPATSVDELQRQGVFSAKKNNGQNKALSSDGKDVQRLSESKNEGTQNNVSSSLLGHVLLGITSKPSKPSKLVHSLHQDLHSILFCHMNSSNCNRSIQILQKSTWPSCAEVASPKGCRPVSSSTVLAHKQHAGSWAWKRPAKGRCEKPTQRPNPPIERRFSRGSTNILWRPSQLQLQELLFPIEATSVIKTSNSNIRKCSLGLWPRVTRIYSIYYAVSIGHKLQFQIVYWNHNFHLHKPAFFNLAACFATPGVAISFNLSCQSLDRTGFYTQAFTTRCHKILVHHGQKQLMAISMCFTCLNGFCFTAPQGFAADQDQCLPQPTSRFCCLNVNIHRHLRRNNYLNSIAGNNNNNNNPFHEEKEVVFQRCFLCHPLQRAVHLGGYWRLSEFGPRPQQHLIQVIRDSW